MKAALATRNTKTALLMLALCSVAWTADLAVGERALATGDYAAAVRELMPLATQGNPIAQEDIGDMYQGGHGLPKDDKKAVQWFRLAAAQGNALAETALGFAYFMGGHGVREDDKEGVRWFHLAAAQGNVSAQLNLGIAYEKGLGVPQDNGQAVVWFRLAAANTAEAPTPKAAALCHLGFAYFYGKGVHPREMTTAEYVSKLAQDQTEAVRLFMLAADRGDNQAQVQLGAMYMSGVDVPQDFVQAYMWFTLGKAGVGDDAALRKQLNENLAALAAHMTPSQVAEAKRLAREWKPKTGGG